MIVDELKGIVGDGGWITDPADLVPHLTEWRDTWTGRTPILVAPDSTDQVSAVVSACQKAGVAIVPQGGNTGLCGGAIPDSSGSQVLLSLKRMNRIRTMSPEDHSMIVEAGCTLAQIQDAAADAGRFFPLSLAAEGSCQIGGNLSTDAGGINVLRYGTARAQALGLEVVLADGSVWDGIRTLRKDTAGYDLKQLFIGSEGTLGIITAASLRLYPAIRDSRTAFIALEDAEQAIALFSALREALADRIQAFELIPERAIRYVAKHVPACALPFEPEYSWYVLLEATDCSDEATLNEPLMAAIETGLVRDVVIAKNEAESRQMWQFRHAISESQKKEGASLKHDVSVPVATVAEFIQSAGEAVVEALPGIRPVPFGHVGDGNVHFNLSQPVDADPEDFLGQREALARVVYDVVDRYGGSISAEHGIGQAKRDDLERYRSETEITLMRAIKTALDPQGLLNPGKVI